jgi:acetyltransferase-like isoleucine patch superfamily enzyme
MRNIAKAAARGLSLLAVTPLLAYYALARGIGGGDRVLESCSQALAWLPGLPGQYLRRAFFARTLAECGDTAVISFGVIFSSAATRVGRGAYIGPFCTIGLASIEADVLVAAGAHVPSGPRTHGVAPTAVIRDQPGELKRVTIGRGSWIGNNAVVMADVGAESIVGAGAVVTKPIPARVIAAGVPARVIRSRDEVAAGSA